MAYYRYRPDANSFPGIAFDWEIDSPEEVRVLGVHNVDAPVLSEWTPPVAYELEDNPPAPTQGDFPSLSSYWRVPIMSQRAWDALRPLIGYCCEALPIVHPSGQRFYIIHVMDRDSGGELLVDDEFRKAVEHDHLQGLLFDAVPQIDRLIRGKELGRLKWTRSLTVGVPVFSGILSSGTRQ